MGDALDVGESVSCTRAIGVLLRINKHSRRKVYRLRAKDACSTTGMRLLER